MQPSFITVFFFSISLLDIFYLVKETANNTQCKYKQTLVITSESQSIIFRQDAMRGRGVGLVVKQMTHMAILYADRGDRRIKSPISGCQISRRLNSLAFAKCARCHGFLRLSLRIATKVNQSGWVILSHNISKLGHEHGK